MPHYILDARVATPYFPGIGRYVTNLAAALIPLLAADEQLTILHDPAHPPSLPPSERVQTVPASVSPFSLRQQWQLPRLLRQLRAAGFQPPPSSPQLPASSFQLPAPTLYHSPYYLMPYRPGLTTVLTVYDLIPLLFPEHSTPRARLLFRWATELALRTASVVIAISAATRADFLARFRLAPERVVAIPLAADPIFRPQSAEAIADVRARYNLPERYVLYLGSNKPHKNLVRLIEAFSRITHLASRLIIAGAWDARYPEAKARADALGLGDHVRFLGPVRGTDLPALYAGADLFVFPSLYEGFGLPVLEAMACGVPVVCSNAASLAEITSPPGPLSYVERGSVLSAALLVDPLDVNALAEAIRRVLTDPDLAAELQACGLTHAARFSWTRTAQETLAVYRRVLRSVEPIVKRLSADSHDRDRREKFYE